VGLGCKYAHLSYALECIIRDAVSTCVRETNAKCIVCIETGIVTGSLHKFFKVQCLQRWLSLVESMQSMFEHIQISTTFMSLVMNEMIIITELSMRWNE